MTMQQAMKALLMWQTGAFDTYDIAKELDVPESLVYATVARVREHVRAA